MLREAGIALGDHVAQGLPQVVAHHTQVLIGLAKIQVLKEDLVELVVPVLSRMHQTVIKVAVASLDDLRETDNLGPGAHHGHELELCHGHTSSR